MCLILSLSIVLAHSIFPHHHHSVSDQTVHNDDPDHDHHHEDSDHDHHHHDDDSENHNIFTFGQLEDSFLTSKQVVLSTIALDAIEVPVWPFEIPRLKKNENFCIKDIELPPLLRCLQIDFRGPPSI
jgi:hypothetical protein